MSLSRRAEALYHRIEPTRNDSGQMSTFTRAFPGRPARAERNYRGVNGAERRPRVGRVLLFHQKEDLLDYRARGVGADLAAPELHADPELAQQRPREQAHQVGVARDPRVDTVK